MALVNRLWRAREHAYETQMREEARRGYFVIEDNAPIQLPQSELSLCRPPPRHPAKFMPEHAGPWCIAEFWSYGRTYTGHDGNNF